MSTLTCRPCQLHVSFQHHCLQCTCPSTNQRIGRFCSLEATAHPCTRMGSMPAVASWLMVPSPQSTISTRCCCSSRMDDTFRCAVGAPDDVPSHCTARPVGTWHSAGTCCPCSSCGRAASAVETAAGAAALLVAECTTRSAFAGSAAGMLCGSSAESAVGSAACAGAVTGWLTGTTGGAAAAATPGGPAAEDEAVEAGCLPITALLPVAVEGCKAAALSAAAGACCTGGRSAEAACSSLPCCSAVYSLSTSSGFSP